MLFNDPNPPLVVAAVFAMVCFVPIAVLTTTAVIVVGNVARVPRFLCRLNLQVCGFISACFFAGGSIGWMLRPTEWQYTLSRSMYMGMNAAEFGHPLEHTAEQLVVACFFFPAVLAAIMATATIIAITVVKARRVAQARLTA